MRWYPFLAIAAVALAAALPYAIAEASSGLEQSFDRSNTDLKIERLTYRGKPAVKVLESSGNDQASPLVMLPATDFQNGVIEAEVAGLPARGAPADIRGFIGIAFRVQSDPSRYEAFYIRPTNGRAEEQIRRNHATQYIGMPDYPWFKLRKETPGVYESYADMVAGEWTKLRIEVDGAKARLFVNGASQPSLIVNDLKLGADARGGVALWVGNWTEGYFTDVRVTPRR